MGEGRERDEAFVTLATNDTYALGCLVLGNSLRRVGTARQLVVMVTQGVSPSMRDQLGGLFDQTVPVNVLDSSDTCNLELLGRPDLSVTFTKFHCWRLTQFKKCVFMDADTLVVQNIDELFDREELSAAPDAGWPDCFNSGVFVYVPSEETYRNLLAFAITSGSFDGGDQGLLNSYFKDWATKDIGKHLPFTYNVVSQAFYSYLPALKQFFDNIKVVHFIGAVKPWHHAYNTATRTVTPLPNTGHSQQFLQLWWDIFIDSVQPNLDPQLNAYVGLEQQQHPPLPPPPPEHGTVSSLPLAQDQHGHSHTRAAPTTTYVILYPYTPPPVDGSSAEGSPTSQIVDVPVVYRDYSSLETHYTEQPFSIVNLELPPATHYWASEEITGARFNEATHTHDKSPDNDGHLQQAKGEGTLQNGPSKWQVDGKDENENNSLQGGLIGDLASINLSGGAGDPMKDDRERKLQWEQGQADYMGVDKFDNIKARLDEKIAQSTPSGTNIASATEEASKVSPSLGDVTVSPATAWPDSRDQELLFSVVTLPAGKEIATVYDTPESSPSQNISASVGGEDESGPTNQLDSMTATLAEPAESAPWPVQPESDTSQTIPSKTEAQDVIIAAPSSALLSLELAEHSEATTVALSSSTDHSLDAAELGHSVFPASLSLLPAESNSLGVKLVSELSPVLLVDSVVSDELSLTSESSSHALPPVSESTPVVKELPTVTDSPVVSQILAPLSDPISESVEEIQTSVPKPVLKELANQPEALVDASASTPQPKAVRPDKPVSPTGTVPPSVAVKPEKPISIVPTSPSKPNSVSPSKAPKPTLTPVSPPATAPKPSFALTTQAVVAPKSSTVFSPATAKLTSPEVELGPAGQVREPKPRPTAFSFQEQVSKSPSSPPLPESPKPAAGPISPSVSLGSKFSLVSSQASRFEKPGPLSTAATTPKTGSPLGALAARFESPGTKVQPAVQAVSAPTTTQAKVSIPQSKPSTTTSKSSQSPTAASKPSGSATNREEMLTRFGVRLPPPKK